MSKSFKIINQISNEAIIESELEFATSHNEPFSIALFELDDENTYVLKKAIKFIHNTLNFTHILYDGDGRFFVLMRNTRISNCLKKVFDLSENLKKDFPLEEFIIGLTESEEKDTFKTITTRVNKFYLKAFHAEDKGVFYGTTHYEKSTNESINNALMNIFKMDNKVTIYNFYKGLMISEEGSIVSNKLGEIVVKIPRQKYLYFMQETFTYIEHLMIPHITKADIIAHDKLKATLTLKNFSIQQNSPVGRTTKRLEIEKKMPAQIKALSNQMIIGRVKNLSLDSILIEAKDTEIDFLLKNGTSFQALFNIHEDDDNIYKIIAPAFFVNRKSPTEVAFSISPTKAQKGKISKFLANLEKVILFSLRNTLIEKIHSN